MNLLLRRQLGPEGSGTIPSYVVSDSGPPFPGSSVLLLSSSLAYLEIIVHVLADYLFGADAIVVAVPAVIAVDTAAAVAILIPTAVAVRSTAVVTVLVAPAETPSAVAAVAVAVVVVLVAAAAGPHWRWLWWWLWR